MAFDPVTAIADAIGSIANVIGVFKANNTAKDLAEINGRPTYHNPFDKAQEKDNTYIVVIGVIGFLLAILILVKLVK